MLVFSSVGLWLLFCGIFALSFYKIYQEIDQARTDKKAMDLIDTDYKPDISGAVLEKPDAMVLGNQIRIAGEAADSLIISLKVNGKVVAAKLPQNGQFEFNDISLGYGSNTILVLGLDTNGNSKILQKIETTPGSPRLSFLARDVTRGNVHRKEIALTFDGGAGNGATESILNILKSKVCQCTIFLTGGFLKRYPEQTMQMVKDGHEIGNHTWSHAHLTSFADNHEHATLPAITRDKLQHELLETATLFHKITGKKMKPYWRAPFGEHNQEIRMWAAELGYQQIGWTYGHGESMDSMDWVADTTNASYKSADEILQKLLNFGESTESSANGCIVLMHLDTQRQEDQVHHIIPVFIDSMRARGYKFTTVTDLLRP